MAPFEKDIFDQAVINAVNLERLSQGLQRKIIGMLLQAQREIIAEIVDTDPTAVKATNWKKARMARLTKQINDILNKNYKSIHLTVMKELVALASLEATYTAQQLNKLIGVDLFQVTLTEDYLKSIVENTLIQGGTIKEWFNTQALNAKQRLSRTLAEAVYKSNVLQMGMVKGESVNELTRAVKGIKVESRSGPLGLAQREAEALVRTSVMQVANQTRYAMYMGNKDLIKGFKLIAVLDSRTTPFCQAADQGEYDINWNPISPKAVIVLGPPPYHFNCRTSYIALLKSFEEIVDESMKGASSTQKRLAKALDQRLSEIGERASEQGPVASNMNYNEWLKTQPKSVQIDVLGKGRQRIWEEKGLSVSDLLGQKGRPLTLKELREKYKL